MEKRKPKRRKTNGKIANERSNRAIIYIAEELVRATSAIVKAANNEEELRIEFEKILAPLLKTLGIETTPRYERHPADVKSIFHGRPDAVHGSVVIEYERPRAFSSKRAVNHAFAQLVDYIIAEAANYKDQPKGFKRIIGVGFDGDSVFFVKFVGKIIKGSRISKEKDFIRSGPYPFDPQAARTFLIYLRALRRLPLTAENLAKRFGPESKIAPLAVSAFADALMNWGTERVPIFLNEWKRLFGIVYGEQFSAHQKEEAEALSRLYNAGQETDFQELLFSIHTYFALLMKFIAAELLTLRDTGFGSSFCHQLTHSLKRELKAQLIDIEEGGIYTRKGITNFLEGDFFRWYLDALSPRLYDAIREIARGLSEFEPATSSIEPESTRDLLKKLYQYLVPQQVRHRLGEYYTPDWLAELVIKEVGYDGNTLKRLLDPACGSGTFLVFAIKKAREYGIQNNEPPLETGKRIVSNIWGFDLNPLAVIASRTNYLFALGELTQELDSFEIPIYLADSVLWPEKSGQLQLGSVGESIGIPTSLKVFFVPSIWVKDKGFLLGRAAPIIEDMINDQYTVSDAMKRFRKEGLLYPPHEEVVSNFYEDILNLNKEAKNGIWVRFLKNAFAPITAGKFDFVIGNPPWIRWDYLSQEYRKATLPLWKNYGLFSLKGFETRLGGGKKDFSMLFTYAACDYYLKDGAKLGFLITQEVYKAKGAGEGFRNFHLGVGEEGKDLKVLKAHDLVTIQPFERAANKTAAIFIKKGNKTSYPVPYYLWAKKKGVGNIPTDFSLDEALSCLKKERLLARPVGVINSSWQTVTPRAEYLLALKGTNSYVAVLGANPNPYGIFWLEVKQSMSDGKLLVRNLTEKGKKKIPSVENRIEADLVYPAIRGSDIQRWGAESQIFMLIVQDPKKGCGYPEELMKQKWPRTYSYLTQFRKPLLERALYKKYHEQSRNPFYSQFNISEKTFSHFKVVWKAMSNDLYASVISQIKTAIGFKIAIPLHTTSFFSTNDEDEAHYLCAIINSIPVREFVKSFSSAGRGFGTPSIMLHIGIPKFDLQNSLHKKLAQISRTLHKLKGKNELEEIPKLAKQNDDLVRKLFRITGK